MNTPLTEFQRVNGGEDDLLPLYNITKETKEANKNIMTIIILLMTQTKIQRRNLQSA